MGKHSEFNFYVVWGEDPTAPPTVKHDDPYKAKAEAKRLAVANPGKRFVVLAAVVGFTSPEQILETVFDDIPF